MKKLLILLILFTPLLVWAYSSPKAPVLKTEPLEEQQFLNQVADNWNVLQVVTVNPDGAQRGKYGEAVILYTGGTYYLQICVSSPAGTVWRGVALSNTP